MSVSKGRGEENPKKISVKKKSSLRSHPQNISPFPNFPSDLRFSWFKYSSSFFFVPQRIGEENLSIFFHPRFSLDLFNNVIRVSLWFRAFENRRAYLLVSKVQIGPVDLGESMGC